MILINQGNFKIKFGEKEFNHFSIKTLYNILIKNKKIKNKCPKRLISDFNIYNIIKSENDEKFTYQRQIDKEEREIKPEDFNKYGKFLYKNF